MRERALITFLAFSVFRKIANLLTLLFFFLPCCLQHFFVVAVPTFFLEVTLAILKDSLASLFGCISIRLPLAVPLTRFYAGRNGIGLFWPVGCDSLRLLGFQAHRLQPSLHRTVHPLVIVDA